MKIPFISSDECEHEEWELKPSNGVAHDARWVGDDATLRRIKTYYKHCANCGERLGHMGHDSVGNIGHEVIESITIPADVVNEYRDDTPE